MGGQEVKLEWKGRGISGVHEHGSFYGGLLACTLEENKFKTTKLQYSDNFAG